MLAQYPDYAGIKKINFGIFFRFLGIIQDSIVAKQTTGDIVSMGKGN